MPLPTVPYIPRLLLVTAGLQLSAAASAAVIAIGRVDHRPVAGFLGAMVLAFVARFGLVTWLIEPFHASHPGEPLTGSVALAGHLDAALFIAWPAGIASTAIAVFLKRRPLAVGVAWLAASIAIGAAYPLTRGDVLRRCYLAAVLASLVVSIGAMAMWTRRNERVTLPRAAVLLLMLFELSTLLGPWMGDPFNDWNRAQILYSTLYAGLIALQGGTIDRPFGRTVTTARVVLGAFANVVLLCGVRARSLRGEGAPRGRLPSRPPLPRNEYPGCP
jgi:hypothetical protein